MTTRKIGLYSGPDSIKFTLPLIERVAAYVDRFVGADMVNELAVPPSGPGGVPARLSTAASGGGGGIWRNDIVEN